MEVAGIEPASFGTEPGLLRVELAVVFSALTVSQARCDQAQPLFDVLDALAASAPSKAS